MTLLLDYIIIGIIQGVFEWLPVSSKTIILLYGLLVSRLSLLESYLLGLFIQAGCVISAILYYRNILLSRDLFVYRFVTIATVSTIATGIPLYLFLLGYLERSINSGVVTIVTGFILFVLGLIHRSALMRNTTKRDAQLSDAIYMGLAQGLAIAPGVSRSGVTVLVLLSLGLSVEDSFKYSFISSIPVNVGAMILVSLTQRGYLSNHIDTPGLLAALIISALVGYITIDVLTRTARRHGWRTTLMIAVVTITIGLLTLG
ncbi:MAG: undecaprenyl-diphosphate phosphatase [Desulfurococcaceae archaeon]